MRPATGRGPLGFTLVELLVVMVIIGILMSFILGVAMDGVRRAEERATQSLIAKLDSAITDRLEALLQSRPDPTNIHSNIASVFYSSPAFQPGYQRAQVLAMFDYVKSELPDVFYFPQQGDKDYDPNYPINFAATAWDGNTSTKTSAGASVTPYHLPIDSYPVRSSTVTGIYGASFTARAALYKNLPGILPAGFDGTDNNGNGLIDEAAEAGGATLFTTAAGLHQHKTARAEMLYALLVEGQGPFGSAFNRDDFTDKEVRDTDNDGLPEFTDAWGEPLQFYRWPVAFHSDLQRGIDLTNSPPLPPYGDPTSANYPTNGGVFESREQDPLDANQTLMAPSWWYSFSNVNPILGVSPPSSPSISNAAWFFHTYFHPLIEPLASSAPTKPPAAFVFWDRSGGARRAFYTKFLIASSGLDRELGIARIDMYTGSISINVNTLWLESQARQGDLNATSTAYLTPVTPNWINPVTQNTLQTSAQDDITNHNLVAPGGGMQ
jgi:prepilin-type N-terminal cleavage/methylation domain-containing protein